MKEVMEAEAIKGKVKVEVMVEKLNSEEFKRGLEQAIKQIVKVEVDTHVKKFKPKQQRKITLKDTNAIKRPLTSLFLYSKENREKVQEEKKCFLKEKTQQISDIEYNNGKRSFLSRIWDTNLPLVNILMNNPSTADEKNDDTTVKRCVDICKYNSFGGINIYNINAETPLKEGGVLILAWGNIGKNKHKIQLEKLNTKKLKLLCFGKNKNGTPKMPTRLPLKTKIIAY